MIQVCRRMPRLALIGRAILPYWSGLEDIIYQSQPKAARKPHLTIFDLWPRSVPYLDRAIAAS